MYKATALVMTLTLILCWP